LRRRTEGTYHVATQGEIVACLSYNEGIFIYLSNDGKLESKMKIEMRLILQLMHRCSTTMLIVYSLFAYPLIQMREDNRRIL
jgi:hypothetical protein